MAGISDNQALELLIRVRDAASASLQKINKGLAGVRGDAARLGDHFDSLSRSTFTLRNAFLSLGAGMAARSVLKSAFQFNQTIEQSRVGIAALVRTFNDFTTKQGQVASSTQAFAESMRIATQIQRQLQIEGLKTVATYDELLRALQEGIGPAMKAGFNPEQIVRFTSLMTQAASAISLPMDQLGQELRAITEGTIDRNARIAKALGVTNEKVNELAKSGELFDYLSGRLAEFGAAGEAIAKTFGGAMSNVKDAVQMALGQGLEGTFRGTTKLLLDLRDAIVTIDEKAGSFTFNTAITQALARVDWAISSLLTGNGKSMKENLERWVDLLGDLAVAFIQVVGAILKMVDALGPMLPTLVKGGAYWLMFASALVLVVTPMQKAYLGLTMLYGGIKLLGGYVIAAALAGLNGLRLGLIALVAQGGLAATALKLLYVALIPLRGAFFLVGAAAVYGVVQIGKLIKAIGEWRTAVKDAEQAEVNLFTTTAKIKAKYEGWKDITIPVKLEDQSADELEALRKNLQQAKAYWTASITELEARAAKTSLLGNPTADAKEAQTALGLVKTKLDDIVTTIRTIRGLIATPKDDGEDDPEEIKKARADQTRLQKMLDDDLARLSGDKWAVQKAQAKQHYDEMIELAHGNQDLLLQAESVYARQLAKIRDEQHKELQTAATESQNERTRAVLQTQLVALQGFYAQGDVALQEYFRRRQEIVNKQYAAEIQALQELAAMETQDPAKRQQIETDIFVKRQEQTQALLELEQNRIQAEKDLLQQAAEAEGILLNLRERSEITPASQLSAVFAQELAQMDHFQQEEIRRLQELHATKTSLDEAYRRQKLEKENLLADQVRRLDQSRLESAQQVAAAMSSIFGNLYEASGQKIKAFFYLQRAAAAAEAIINAELSAAKALGQQGPFGIPMAALVRAMGYANAFAIMAQTVSGYSIGGKIRGYDDGGRVPGHSPHSKADNVLIRATAGEYMQPVDTVRYYGVQAMEAIRRKLIPKDFLSGFAVPNLRMAMPRFAFAEGGQVGGGAGAPAQGGDAAGWTGRGGDSPGTTIVNILDPDEYARFVQSSRGTDVQLNWMSSKSTRIKRALGIK